MNRKIILATYYLKKWRYRAAAIAFIVGLVALGILDPLLGSLAAVAAATSPAFASVPPSNFTPGSLTAANTALDGTGTTLLVATAPATASGGSVVESLRCMHKGTNVATVLRVFKNNGSTPTVAGNNSLIAEKTMPANTISQVAESVPVDIVINEPLKANASTPERIYVSIGTAVAAGVQFHPKGGDL